MQLYVAAHQDYQFQVNLTWSRTQYCLTLNAGLLSVAAALYKIGAEISVIPIIAVLSAGFIIAIFSILALKAGRSYYEPVNQRLRRLEYRLGIVDYGVRTTPEQGGRKRVMTVTRSFITLMLGLGLLDLMGIAYLGYNAIRG